MPQSSTHPVDRSQTMAATIAHRRNACRRYLTRLHTTYPPLPLADRQELADLLVNGPGDANAR